MWPNPQETADLVVFTEKILNGNIHFLYNETLLLPIFLTKIFATNFSEFTTKYTVKYLVLIFNF